MKPWTRDFIINIAVLVVLGALVASEGTPGSFFFWLAGMMCGYGLRIGMVNVWPKIFSPRIAYENEAENSQCQKS